MTNPRKRNKRQASLSSQLETKNDTENQIQKLHVSVLTDSMLESFRAVGKALECPLCHGLIQNPQTLAACAHSFCLECIDFYTCDNWQCPVEGCGQSIALRGSRKGKYRRINPALETIALSWQSIHGALSRAPPEWWKEKKKIMPSVNHSNEENDKEEEEGVEDEGEEVDFNAPQKQLSKPSSQKVTFQQETDGGPEDWANFST